MEPSDRYLSYMGRGPKRIPHWEHWSCPDAETYLTGIDYYEHPKLCRERMRKLYPQLELPIVETDTPKPGPLLNNDGQSSRVDEEGRHFVRWGDSESSDWNFGKEFKTAEDVFVYSPLADPRNNEWLDEDKQFEKLRKNFPVEYGNKAPEGQVSWTSFTTPCLCGHF